jgi:hypothetical protein
MKITTKDLHEWIMQDVPIKYHGKIYKAFYNGRKYFISDRHTGETIELYKKERGIYGLETNR